MVPLLRRTGEFTKKEQKGTFWGDGEVPCFVWGTDNGGIVVKTHPVDHQSLYCTVCMLYLNTKLRYFSYSKPPFSPQIFFPFVQPEVFIRQQSATNVYQEEQLRAFLLLVN